MNFFLLGIDYKVAPIGVREEAYWQRARIAGSLSAYGEARFAILSTCNRFEIYGVTKDAREAEAAVAVLRARFGTIFDDSYAVYGPDNISRHLTRLAAGLESQVRGEREIAVQLGAWASQEAFPQELADRVYDALFAAQGLRAKMDPNTQGRNIAISVYAELFKRHDSDDLLNIVIAGTGNIAGLFASCKPRGVRLYFAAHKNIHRARLLALKSQGTALMLKQLPEALLDADAFISATSSPHRVFDKKYFSKIAALRDKKLYIYDLALPRDISPDVSGVEGMVLKNIDEVFTDVDIKNRNAAESFSR